MTEPKVATLFDVAPDPKSRARRLAVPYEELQLDDGDEDTVDPIHVNRLVNSIHLWGLTTALIVTPLKKGGYKVEAGRHRYTSLGILREGGYKFNDGNESYELEPQLSRFSKVPCVIMEDLPGGDASRAALTLMENALRRQNPMAELDCLLTMKAEGHDEKTIFRLTGMPAALQRKRLRLNKLSAPMKRAVNEGHLTPSNALRVASLPKDKQNDILKVYRERIGKEATGKEKITADDINTVRRVQVTTALRGIPDEAFAEVPKTSGLEAQVAKFKAVIKHCLDDNFEAAFAEAQAANLEFGYKIKGAKK